MELQSTDELKRHLAQTDEEYRRLAEQHATLKGQIDALEAKPSLSAAEELEEQRLKKLKLAAKDRMMDIVRRAEAQHVSV